jgi:DNA-binding NtrC family response regulator
MTQTKRAFLTRFRWWNDDEAVRAVMNATLENKCFDVILAANVAEALKRAKTDSIDMVIPDLRMRSAEVTAKCHAQPPALKLPVSGCTDLNGAMDAVVLEAGRYHLEAVYPDAKRKSGRRDIAALCE